MKLPQQLSWETASKRWAAILSPLINSPTATPVLLQNIPIVSGTNVINHTLGRKLIGWIPVRVKSSATFFDTQDQNQMPQLTLQLTASADTNIDLLVF